MAKLLIRNRNKDKYYKDGRAKPANWEYRFEIASVGGKRAHCSEAGFKTKAEAEEAGTKAKALYESSGQTFRPSEMSVADYLDYWLDTYGKTNLKDTTIVGYQKKIRLYIKPALGHYRLKSLSPSVIQELINKMFNEGFSRNTLSSIKGIMTASLDYAVEPCKFLAVNPALHVRLPLKRAKSEVPTRRKERRPVTKEEWEDIDFENGTLQISRQIQMNEHTKLWEFQPPKYDSYRTISVDANTLSLLERTKKKQDHRHYIGGLFLFVHTFLVHIFL